MDDDQDVYNYNDFEGDYDEENDNDQYEDPQEIQKQVSEEKQINILGQLNKQYACQNTLIYIQTLLGDIQHLISQLDVSSGKALQLLMESKYNTILALQPNDKQIEDIYNIQESQKTNECIICLESNKKELFSLLCNHQFCKNCWSQFIQECLNQGFQKLLIPCLMEGCNQKLGLDMIEQLIPKNIYEKYINYLIKNICINSDHVLQCPGQNCNYLIIINDKKIQHFLNKKVNIICDCGKIFCSKCKEDTHVPIDCEMNKEWNILLSGGKENLNDMWLKLNTKKCPKCQVTIEKNQGCMHMTCKNCKYEFCWICFKYQTSAHTCNVPITPSQQIIQQKNKEKLELYNFYSTRYIEHLKSVEFAQQKKAKFLNLMQKNTNDSTFCFLNKYLEPVLNTIIECRRVLAYSYALAYYMKEKHKPQFEFQQGELQQNLEKLDQKTDVELENISCDYQESNNQQSIVHLNQTITKYFNNMINYFEQEIEIEYHKFEENNEEQKKDEEKKRQKKSSSFSVKKKKIVKKGKI